MFLLYFLLVNNSTHTLTWRKYFIVFTATHPHIKIPSWLAGWVSHNIVLLWLLMSQSIVEGTMRVLVLYIQSSFGHSTLILVVLPSSVVYKHLFFKRGWNMFFSRGGWDRLKGNLCHYREIRSFLSLEISKGGQKDFFGIVRRVGHPTPPATWPPNLQ